jgi:hypothetical protein
MPTRFVLLRRQGDLLEQRNAVEWEGKSEAGLSDAANLSHTV